MTREKVTGYNEKRETKPTSVDTIKKKKHHVDEIGNQSLPWLNLLTIQLLSFT